jgi:hypothetical protein
MPTTRKPVNRRRTRQLSPEAIAAWCACDYRALHCALGLKPMEASPLPYEISILGVDDSDFDQMRASVRGDGPWSRSLKRAVRLRRQLIKVAGYPSEARRVLEENLAEAIRNFDIARNDIGNPTRQARLEDCEAWIAFYKEHLNELDAVQE